ncbi:MAG: mandelate racemase/muconate lactonizing enzyme family protein [Vulcanimicrobiaceae bacterium]
MTKLREVRAVACRAPISIPLETSFGIMRDRPMLLVRVEDTDGAVGWGEVWCNFPAVGIKHRTRLVESVIAPLLEGVDVSEPRTAFEMLVRRTRILAIQSGEPGPIAQSIAGVDCALWDLKARKAGVPLFRLLGGATPAIAVYASGINPDGPQLVAAQMRDAGYRAFKLKIGFGLERDATNLRAMRAELGDGYALMADANQAWELPQAVQAVETLAEFSLEWVEEPLRADAPPSQWGALDARSSIPIAVGENLGSRDAFDAAIAGHSIDVIQPDVSKWGGLSACVPIARAAIAAGKRFCPHFLGGAVGLAASAHFLAAVGGDGRLEMDANDNPLRTFCGGALTRVVDGTVTLDDAPGIGIEPNLRALEPYVILDRKVALA